MEYIIVSIVLVGIAIAIKFALNIKIKDIKKLKELAFNKEKNIIIDKLPENEEIAKEILKGFNNNHTKVKKSENPKDTTSIYVVLTDSIIIANIKNTFTRVQTIAHECIHSMQDKATLWFNFIYTNLYNLLLVALIVLKLFNIIDNMLGLLLLMLAGFIYYVVRAYLENDAMLKAKYVAKEYMEKSNLLTNKEIEEITAGYEDINTIGVKIYLYRLLLEVLVRTLIFSVICIF